MFKKTLLLIFIFCLTGCGTGSKQPEPAAPPAPAAAQSQVVTITAAGDFLMHMPVVQSARQPDGSYDFKPIFSNVKNLLADPDLTIVNLETRLAGPAYGFSGYPAFNTPTELAYDMKELGIDVVLTANNHSLDRGWPGIVNTLHNLEAAGLLPVGTYRSREEAGKALIIEVKNIKIGLLNYTESTNGLPLPRGKEFAVNLMHKDKIYADIENLKAAGAEVIVACLHFGAEYTRYPNRQQVALVEELLQRGVDIVLGNHVHVIQPMDWPKINAGSSTKQCFVAYSLGNFISNQQWRYSDCGVLVNIEIAKENHQVAVKGVDYVPVWVDTYVQNGRTKYRVLPVEKAMADYLAHSDPLLTAEDYKKLVQVWQDTTSLISGACPVIAPRQLTGSKV
ncbi:CapA family protein [Desulforamulus hydrothermalis]|uniref:Poly-gamma-glutamate synthesis protein (Capsule biosynthesis protein) n=1 Tax=Desulforamulus hydrothermalis Lam5 = DSM 18033 TaxID=1121428 RepID=K8E111_9FIRM|nr:CapA family protein [Desulforamulus hydrothermalis]CCO09305.1 Poly-gamma-glutamate synthesis protein (Capsule biosynthesis protein) [Desulforamulus hydrothermalis Lam5 = DSM 18033]SHH04511.1 poly-gamma-glutamate synthesis protein (capsule biosynthesis protein) [Desulforamulus hydrothermalis Lam5 = DSM 18033]